MSKSATKKCVLMTMWSTTTVVTFVLSLMLAIDKAKAETKMTAYVESAPASIDGSIVRIKEGDQLTLTCYAEQRPNITCQGDNLSHTPNQSHGHFGHTYTSSITVTASKNFDLVTCTCQIPGGSETSELTFRVYVLTCTHEFVDKNLRVTCLTNVEYKDVKCKWQSWLNNKELTSATTNSHNNVMCSSDRYISNFGSYKFNLTITSDTSREVQFSTTYTMNIEPPDLVISSRHSNLLKNDIIDLYERNQITLECTVRGGNTPASNIGITCFKTNSDAPVFTHQSKLDIVANRTMDKMKCSCTADSVIESYQLQSNVTFNVKYTPDKPPVISTIPLNAMVNSSIRVTAGEALEIVCTVEGGNPNVEYVSFTCDRKVFYTYESWGTYISSSGTELRKNLTITSNFDRANCVCRARHVTNEYTLSSSVNFGVKYPPVRPPVISTTPTNAKVGSIIRVNASQVVEIVCTVEGGNPKVDSVNFTCNRNILEGNWRNFETTRGREIRKNTTIARDIDQVQCECRASHVTGQYKLSSSVNFNVKYPPDTSPVISTIPQNATNGSSIRVTAGQALEIVCTVEGGNPRVDSVRFTCDREVFYNNGYWSKYITSLGTEMRTLTTITNNFNQAQCVCRASHVTRQYNLSSSVNFDVKYLPDKFPIISTIPQNATNGSSIQVTAGQALEIVCTVEGGNPKVDSVRFTCNKNILDKNWRNDETYWRREIRTNTMITSYFDQAVCKCNASHVTGQYKLSSSVNFDVKYPPDKFPVISTIPDNAINGSSIRVTAGEAIEIECTVEGGNPSVDSVSFSCDREVFYTDGSWGPNGYWSKYISSRGTHIRKNLTFKSSFHQAVCVCGARHVTRQYKLSSSVNFDVKFQAYISSLTVNNETPKPSKYIGVNQLTVLRCSVSSNPITRTQILYTDHVNTKILNVSSDNYIEYTFTSKCNDSGVYSCSAKNNISIGNGDFKNFTMKIYCGISHCDSQQMEHKYGVPVNKDVSLSMCAVSYPRPTQFSLLFNGKPANKKRYNIGYTYMNEISARGSLDIIIFNLTEKEFGSYQVLSSNVYHTQSLSFQLTAKGPPLCPENLTALYVGENIVSLSWTPGFNGGLVQSFLVQDMTGGKLLANISEHETHRETIVYNVTGLSANTNYSFSVDGENSEGKRTCPNITIATSGIANSPLSNYYFIQIVASTVCVILVILVAIVIITSVFVKKNRMRIGKRVRNADNKGLIEVDNNKSIYSLQNTFEASDGAVSHNVYNNQPMVKYLKSSQQDQTENVAIYCNAASAGTNNNMETEGEGETAVYDEGGTGQVARQEQEVGRYRNQDGLVYVSVEINPQTTFPEIRGAKSDDVQEVSYADIQFHKN